MKLETKAIYILDGLRLYQASHSAMATMFRVSILATSERTARDAAKSCFRLIDELEGHLSRFRHGSDVHVINQTPAGYPARVGPDCWTCLTFAYRMWQMTNGLSDITVGALVNWYREKPTEEPPASLLAGIGFQHLHLLPDYHAAMRGHDGLVLDLGSLGKGYALDRIAAHLLDDWDIGSFMLECGGSSAVFHVSADSTWAWPVAIASGPNFDSHLLLRTGSLGGSAADLKPAHLVNPHTGKALPPQQGAWAYAQNAMMSDALSTAFTLMDSENIAKLCNSNADVGARLLRGDECQTIGNFPDEAPLP